MARTKTSAKAAAKAAQKRGVRADIPRKVLKAAKGKPRASCLDF